MATFTYKSNLGEYGTIANFIDGATLSSFGTATTIDVTDQFGAGAFIEGSGFTYDEFGLPQGGMISRIGFHDSADRNLLVVEGSINAGVLFDRFVTTGLKAAVDYLFSGADRLFGSDVGDLLEGGGRADTIRGAEGDDMINGQSGDDLLIGGRGADMFAFRNASDDRILDFKDTGGGSDDMIVVSGRMFRSKVVTELVDGVLLDFGAKGTLMVDGWTAAEVGRDDFLIL